MRLSEPFTTASGYVTKALPLHKWRRKDGLASFVRDLIDLRKTLLLCPSCEQKMPRRWLGQYNYALVTGFHTEDTGCDYCRQLGCPNMYVAQDGKFHQEMVLAERRVRETRQREAEALQRDWRYMVGQ